VWTAPHSWIFVAVPGVITSICAVVGICLTIMQYHPGTGESIKLRETIHPDAATAAQSAPLQQLAQTPMPQTPSLPVMVTAISTMRACAPTSTGTHIPNWQAELITKKGLDDYRAGKLAEAVQHFCTAAQAGYGRAQLALGEMYNQGGGIPRDFTSAAYWYKEAEKSSDPWSQHVAKMRLEPST